MTRHGVAGFVSLKGRSPARDAFMEDAVLMEEV